MKRMAWALLLALSLAACGEQKESSASYTTIDPETAKTMMEEHADAVILDVREEDEFVDGHIPGAVLLPVNTITARRAALVIPSKDTTVLVYCRSGSRSKTASRTLAELGYTAIYDFGGIMDWPYDTVYEE